MARDPAARGTFHLSWKQVVTLVGSLGYVASPVDLIPDVLAPFGLGDDAVAVVIAGVTLFTAVRRFRAGRAKPADGPGTAGPGRTATGGAPGVAGTDVPQVTAKPRPKR